MKHYQLLTILIWIVFYSHISNAQDIKSRDLRIKYEPKIGLMMDGNVITRDSCNKRLALFENSRKELQKSLSLQSKASKILSHFAAPLLYPAAAFGAANEITNYKKTWLNTTFLVLVIPGLSLSGYYFILIHKSISHYKKAIDLYNEQVMN